MDHGLGAFHAGPQGVRHVLRHPLHGFHLLAGPSGVGPFDLVNVCHLILHCLDYGVGFLVAQHLEHGGKQFLPVVSDMLLEDPLSSLTLADELSTVLGHALELD